MHSNKQNFDVWITSSHKIFDLHIKETFSYRDLIWLFVKRDFTTKYKQTLLGPLWAFIQPFLTTFVYTLVFGSLAGLTIADVPGTFVLPEFLFYLSGTICWSYFSSVLVGTSGTFINNRGIMGKVYYPRLVSPIVTACSSLISFGIQFIMFILFWLFYYIRGGTSISISIKLLLLPLSVVQMMLLSTGIGIIISAVTTKYRDLQMLVGFGMQLWHYATPVVYGLSLVTTSIKFGKYLSLFLLNPMTIVVTSFRYAVFGFGFFSLSFYLVSWGITLALFFIGVVMFSKIERTFVDTV